MGVAEDPTASGKIGIEVGTVKISVSFLLGEAKVLTAVAGVDTSLKLVGRAGIAKLLVIGCCCCVGTNSSDTFNDAVRLLLEEVVALRSSEEDELYIL
jgi:hypothetical protein